MKSGFRAHGTHQQQKTSYILYDLYLHTIYHTYTTHIHPLRICMHLHLSNQSSQLPAASVPVQVDESEVPLTLGRIRRQRSNQLKGWIHWGKSGKCYNKAAYRQFLNISRSEAKSIAKASAGLAHFKETQSGATASGVVPRTNSCTSTSASTAQQPLDRVRSESQNASFARPETRNSSPQTHLSKST